MIAYIKKFWVTLLGGFVFGIALAILLDIPWRFTLSLAIFLFILNTIIEQASGYSAVTNLANKVFAFAVGVVIFVGLRAVAGYLLDLPAGQVREELVSGNGIWGITTRSITANIVFEILFLVPGMAIAYLVVKEGRFWKTVLVVTCTMLLSWVTWSIKQKSHAEAMKRQTQAVVSLNARGLNNKALINEAAAATSFGIAKELVSVFYRLEGTNIGWNQAITNVVQPGKRVLQLHPNNQPIVFENQAFTEVVLQNANGSFVGGTKTWVEASQFNWVDGNMSTTSKSDKTTPGSTMPASAGKSLMVELQPDQIYDIDDLREGQGWRYLSFNGDFSNRINKGDDQACWKVVDHNLTRSAGWAGKLQVRAGGTPVKLTVNISP